MKYKVFSRGKILNLGHRGFENRAPENTIAAFRLAMAEGADGVELDVHISKDGHLVVIHDPTVDRTTNGSGKVGRMALLVNKETYERALVFLKAVEGYGVKVIVFNSIDIACTWLGLDVNVARAHLQALQAQSVQLDSSLARS